MTQHKKSPQCLILYHTYIYILNNQKPFAREKEGCSKSAAMPSRLVWLAVDGCCSVWEVAYRCPILRAITDHERVREPSWQTSDVCHFTWFKWPSRHVTWLVIFYVLCWISWNHQLFVCWHFRLGFICSRTEIIVNGYVVSLAAYTHDHALYFIWMRRIAPPTSFPVAASWPTSSAGTFVTTRTPKKVHSSGVFGIVPPRL